MSTEDWKNWFHKLKWQFISFKFLSFCTVITLMILLWLSLDNIMFNLIEAVKTLVRDGVIDKAGATDIIKNMQNVLYNSAIGHAVTVFTASITAIIAIKGVSYVMRSKETTELAKTLDSTNLSSKLDKFIPKG